MSKEAVFTMKLEPELRAAFMAEAAAAHRPASQVMREFVQRQREARGYEVFLEDKVALARLQASAGKVSSAEAVEARAAERRAQLAAQVSASS